MSQHKIVFPPSGSNSTQLDTVIFLWGKYTHQDFRLLLVKNLRKLETAKIAPPSDWLEEQVQAQKMFCDRKE